MQRALHIVSLMILSLSFVVQPLFAEEISVSSRVDKTQLLLGDSLQLSITVNGKQNAAPFQLPELDGFDIQYMGPTRNVSIVNGSYSSSVTFNYSLLPTKEGKLAIPSLKVSIDEETYTTDAVAINVGTSEGGNASAQSALKDKIFLQIQIPREEVYLNEPVALKVFLYSTDVKVSDIQYPTLDNVGFIEEEFSKPRQYQQNIKGKIFSIIEFSKMIYPTRTGTLTLGPASLSSNLVVEKSSSRRNNLFNDPFFSSFFGRQEKRSMTITSNKVNLLVKDLPKEGQPQDFTGAVGQYSFDVEIGPSTELGLGDPLTLKMKIGGKGNLQTAKFPNIASSDDFKSYDPNIQERPGLKEFEQVLIPTSVEVKELGALSFVYFNPESGSYQTITKGPFPLTIQPPKDGDELRIVGFDQPLTVLQPETIGQDIIFIKDDPGKIQNIGQRIYHRILFWFLVILTLALFVVSYIFYERSHRLETDSVYARAQKAPRAARAGLAAAQKALHAQDRELFYDTVFKTLQSYLGNRCAIAAGSITVENVREKIEGKNHSEELLKSLTILFAECESVRYASGTINEKQMHDTFIRLQDMIQFMERILS